MIAGGTFGQKTIKPDDSPLWDTQVAFGKLLVFLRSAERNRFCFHLYCPAKNTGHLKNTGNFRQAGPSDASSPRFKLPKAWAQRRFPSMGALIADSRVRAQPPLILPYATRRQCHVVLDFKNYAHARCFQHFRRSCSRCFRRQRDYPEFSHLRHCRLPSF